MDSINIRKQTRECVMQFLYEAEIQKQYDSEVRSVFLTHIQRLRDYENENEIKDVYPIEKGYFNNVIDAVEINLMKIDKLIESSAKNWRVERISKVDLAILRLSIAEIIFMDNIPESVSINEAVELAKKFGNENSSKFINGILGKIVREKKTSHEG
ncbi:MAG TPA: transcription antitermination factor NusB [Anaerovoracaceae bacterium]|nr:transcription antitermination factor NusB [Anaerovoracaceae bacterium]